MKIEQLGENRQMHIIDEKGAGGAHHVYEIMVGGLDDAPSVVAAISFQKGPVLESGWNGCQIEDLLNICAHRLSCFQSGEFPCRENALALTKIQEAIHWLNHRTYGRQIRGVEGKNKA